MLRRIFLAGASGAIGRRLCLLLVRDGWQVTGTTRSEDRAAALRLIARVQARRRPKPEPAAAEPGALQTP